MNRGALFVLAAGVFASVLACGGKDKPAEAPGSSGGAAAGADGGAPATGDLESNKKAFVGECSKEEPGTEAYCGCAWDVARQNYGDEALKPKGTPSTDDLAKIHVKVASACADKFPPEVIERAFMAGCTNKRQDMQQYCACSWHELSSKMPAGELVAERAKKTERYTSAVQESAKKCQKLRPAR